MQGEEVHDNSNECEQCNEMRTKRMPERFKKLVTSRRFLIQNTRTVTRIANTKITRICRAPVVFLSNSNDYHRTHIVALPIGRPVVALSSEARLDAANKHNGSGARGCTCGRLTTLGT